LDIHITLHANSNLVDQIYRQIRSGILDGRLQSGERLPSSRDLARQLGISRKTTLEVFERLASEGFLFARPGSGTYVADAMTRLPSATPRSAAAKARAGSVWETLPTPISMPRP
jgi:GntR family transcriptional regulator/MocR family aminotransferase